MEIKAFASDAAPAAIGPYSPAVRAGDLLFISGQLGLDPATGEFAGDTAASQAAQSLKNVGALLEAAGATYANVVKTTVLLADIADFAAVNEVYGSFFEEPYPARSAFEVGAIPKGGLVEIEVIAAL